MLLCCMCLGLLTGCHGREGMEAFVIPESFDMTRNYEISFWAKNDTNRTQTAIYEKAIADFEKLYPNIDVTLRLYTDYGKIYNDVKFIFVEPAVHRLLVGKVTLYKGKLFVFFKDIKYFFRIFVVRSVIECQSYELSFRISMSVYIALRVGIYA